MIRAIGFDFDDTLIISEREKEKVIVEIFEHTYGITRGVKAAYTRLRGKMNRDQKLLTLVRELVNKEPTKKELKDLDYAYSKGYEFNLSSCPIIHCVSLLKQLRKKVDFMFLLSLENKREVEAVAKHCGVDKYFDEILGGPKSKMQNFDHLIKKHKVDPAHAIYVGDSAADVKKATKLGFRMYAVNPSKTKRAQLKKLGAQKTTADLCDIGLKEFLE
jgi:beta-phosphoglucomutase-like phosphatase (HAD superfamily)